MPQEEFRHGGGVIRLRRGSYGGVKSSQGNVRLLLEPLELRVAVEIVPRQAVEESAGGRVLVPSLLPLVQLGDRIEEVVRVVSERVLPARVVPVPLRGPLRKAP